MGKYICRKCDFCLLDQIGDINCRNPKSKYYEKFVEEAVDNLEECEVFKEADLFEPKLFYKID